MNRAGDRGARCIESGERFDMKVRESRNNFFPLQARLRWRYYCNGEAVFVTDIYAGHPNDVTLKTVFVRT